MSQRFAFRGLVGQLVIAIALTLFVAQAVNFTLLARGQKEQALAHSSGMILARIIDGIEKDRRGDFGDGPHMIPSKNGPNDSRSERRDRGEMRGIGRRNEPGFRLRITDEAQPMPAGAEAMGDVAEFVRKRMTEGGVEAASVRAWALPLEADAAAHNRRGRALIVSADVDGRHYMARGRLVQSGDRLHGFLIRQTLTLYVLLLVPIMLIAWRVAAPLQALTRAARANPMARDTEEIKENGPADVRDLIRAFNAYRARISAMLSDKDRMLGAVGHDLRTPLASLRVRVEQVEDEPLRNKMIASIEEMTAMLADILALARAGSGTEEAERIDGAQLMQELAADYREQGRDVECGMLSPVYVQARPLLLRRALRNLIGNAVEYGGLARLSLTLWDDGVAFIIADEGPGLTDAQIQTLVEPFARGEASRNRATGGTGLGLSIARDVAEGEGGRLMLRRRPEGGLEAIILLPLLPLAP